MAALKMGLTKKLWWGSSVRLYPSLKDAASSSDSFSTFCFNASHVNSKPLGILLAQPAHQLGPASASSHLVSHCRPSVAVSIIDMNTKRQKICSVSVSFF